MINLKLTTVRSYCALRHAYFTLYRRCHDTPHDAAATSATPLVDAVNAKQPGCLKPSDEAILRFKGTVQQLSEDDQMEVGRRIGDALALHKGGIGDLPTAKGVGRIERVPVSDGGCVSLVHPAFTYRKKKHSPPNVPYLSSSKTRECYVGMPKGVVKGMPGLSGESVRDGEYYFEDGLRKVTPYYMLIDNLIDGKKMRKFGRKPTLQDFIDDMFPFHNKKYLRYVIDAGQVFLNFEKVDRDPREVVLKHGDHFARILHMHETPVLDQPIKIVHEDEDLVVVNKPASYVVGPMWNTRLNCVRFSLMKEFGYGDVRNIHRIDRLTSGVLMFAKGPAASRRACNMVRHGLIQGKEYLALVDGEFPDGETFCDRPLRGHTVNSLRSDLYRQEKPSATLFKRLKYNGRVSLLSCELLTGRTHQIRIHLAMLGYHIVNDSSYNPRDLSTVMKDIVDDSVYDAAVKRMMERDQNRKFGVKVGDDRSSSEMSEVEWIANVSEKHGTNDQCIICELNKSNFFREAFQFQDRMFMCLHAWRYTMGDLRVEAEPPEWAQDLNHVDFVMERRERERRLKMEPESEERQLKTEMEPECSWL